MKVFLDTNIILQLFSLSGPDLEEVRKLISLVKAGKLELFLTQQVKDEFRRNRERVISEALGEFKRTKAEAVLPNLIRVYPESEDLVEAVQRTKSLVKELKTKATEDIANNALLADEVIEELFGVARMLPEPDDALVRVQRRISLGNPPGKNGRLGDAIIWETLLASEEVSSDSEFVFLSGDGDFESELNDGKLREFLQEEWDAENEGCTFRFEQSLVVFLSAEFPGIKLADEVEKMVAIEELREANSFAKVHLAIAHLNKFDDFLETEAVELAEIVISNNQIYKILSDEDVHQFAEHLRGLLSNEKHSELRSDIDFLMDLAS